MPALFGLLCLAAHSALRAVNNLLIKKSRKYFIFIEIFELTEYDEHNI
jgi:hypothetical protein